jgi:hypothetical protein
MGCKGGGGGLKVTFVCPLITPAVALTVTIVCCDINVERVSWAVACPLESVVTVAELILPGLNALRLIAIYENGWPFWR